MISDASEAAIDQIVASCNGDLRGATDQPVGMTGGSLCTRLQPNMANHYRGTFGASGWL